MQFLVLSHVLLCQNDLLKSSVYKANRIYGILMSIKYHTYY